MPPLRQGFYTVGGWLRNEGNGGMQEGSEHHLFRMKLEVFGVCSHYGGSRLEAEDEAFSAKIDTLCFERKTR